MTELLVFVLGLALGGWAVAHRMRGSLTWSQVFDLLRGRITFEKSKSGGGGGPNEPL